MKEKFRIPNLLRSGKLHSKVSPRAMAEILEDMAPEAIIANELTFRTPGRKYRAEAFPPTAQFVAHDPGTAKCPWSEEGADWEPPKEFRPFDIVHRVTIEVSKGLVITLHVAYGYL